MAGDAKYELANTAIIVVASVVGVGVVVILGYQLYQAISNYINGVNNSDNPPGSTGLFPNAGPVANGISALIEAPFKLAYNVGGTVESDIVDWIGNELGVGPNQPPLDPSAIPAYNPPPSN